MLNLHCFKQMKNKEKTVNIGPLSFPLSSAIWGSKTTEKKADYWGKCKMFLLRKLNLSTVKKLGLVAILWEAIFGDIYE